MPSIDVRSSVAAQSLSSRSASPTATCNSLTRQSSDSIEGPMTSSLTQRKRSSFRASLLGSASEGSPDSVNNSERSFDAERGSPQPDYDLNSLGIPSSRQKKFLRLFHEVSPEERLLNFYSCALAGDLLLQGHLYVTKNHFAFYSKVFGYVTKLLIPVSDVRRISKEKTVRLFPNAVGITTCTEKHVLTSLLSRDATYRLLTNVWRVHHYPNGSIALTPNDMDREMDGSSINDEQSSNDSFSQRIFPTNGHQSRSEGSRSDDDSAIERSQTPSPAREDDFTSPEIQLRPSANSTPSKFPFEFQNSQHGDEIDSAAAHGNVKGRWLIRIMAFLMATCLVISLLMYYRMHRLHDNLQSHVTTNEELASIQNHILKVRRILETMDPNGNVAKENLR